MHYEPVILPKDGHPHKCVVEWWYYNGLLEAEDGRRFAYMFCLFKVDNKKVAIPLLSRLPVKTVFFSHSLLSDLSRQKFYPTVDYYSVISKDSFKRPLLFANFTNPLLGFGKYVNSVLEEGEGPSFHLKREEFDLHLTSTKSALLEGGKGFLELHDRSTYYYSYTNLATEGIIIMDGEVIKVKGKSWMDHQWADNRYAEDRWTWFSVQLENNVELVCFEYANGEIKDYLASIIYADGHQEHYKKIYFTPLGEPWESKKTHSTYQLNWKIEVPEKDIILEVEPEIKIQEMIFSAIKYWEGPLKVRGKMAGKEVQGQGFLELVGRPLQYGALKLTAELLKELKNKMTWDRV